MLYPIARELLTFKENFRVYVAIEFRHLTLEEHFAKIQETVSAYGAKAIIIKVG